MTRRYAESTKVPVSRSKAEIEKLLRQHGATGFVTGWDERTGTEMLCFRLDERQVKFTVMAPDPAMFGCTPSGRDRSDADIDRCVKQEERRSWRALLLIIKAKLELIAGGDSTVQREFMADLVLPDGRTMSEWIAPQLRAAYERATMPALLPGTE